MPDVAELCRYHESAALTHLFLPMLAQRGRLCITLQNEEEVLRHWLEVKPEQLPVTQVLICDFAGQITDKINYSVGKSERIVKQSLTGRVHVSDCLSGLGNLRVLVVSNDTDVDDYFLDVVARNCPHLIILDARNAKLDSATDLGLDFLYECKKLRRLYLPKYVDCHCSVKKNLLLSHSIHSLFCRKYC